MLRHPGEEVVLTDYGVGRIANAGVDVALYTGDAAGTLLYLAPELAGGGKTNTFASDMCVRVISCPYPYCNLYRSLCSQLRIRSCALVPLFWATQCF